MSFTVLQFFDHIWPILLLAYLVFEQWLTRVQTRVGRCAQTHPIAELDGIIEFHYKASFPFQFHSVP